MDQKVLAGIGNIYADEILFRARLHPERIAARLSAAEVDRLHAAIGEVLAEAIAAEGSSFDAGYRTVLGLEGGFLAQNAMYGRGGQPCPSCGVRDPEDQDRRPDRPPHPLLPPLPARPAAEAVAPALRIPDSRAVGGPLAMSSRPRTDVGLLWEATSGCGRSRDRGSETTPSRLP